MRVVIYLQNVKNTGLLGDKRRAGVADQSMNGKEPGRVILLGRREQRKQLGSRIQYQLIRNNLEYLTV